MQKKDWIIALITLVIGITLGYGVNRSINPSSPPHQGQEVLPEDPSNTAKLSLTQNQAKADAEAKLDAERITEIIQLREELAKKSLALKNLEASLVDKTLLSPEKPTDDSLETREKFAADLLDLTQSRQLIEGAFQTSAKMMVKEPNPEMQEALNALIQKHYDWEKMEKVFTKVYTDLFTADEIANIAAFYRSEVGQSLIKKQPDIMTKTMSLVQEINQETLPKLNEELAAMSKKGKTLDTKSKQ